MGGLGKTILGVGAGFVAAQAGMVGVQKVMSASIGAAMSYEAQMAEIRALTGATEEDTKLLTGSIMDMAQTMPKSPAELGSAAYFILSSGIEDAADAASVLEVAAKASTVGLGETQGVADALTTVLNAYGKSADEAGQVTDVMMEAVKQGKAEASEFAGVLGRVVPLAAQMGISFEEVAANLATFTRLGVSADEAATGLRQVMASLLKPTKDQEEAMGELGFSADGLRQQIKDKGLLATLDEMIRATGGNEAAVAKLFPNIRALTSVLGTAGVQMGAYTDILGATNNATGNLDEGMAIVADTTKFKVDMAMQDLNLTLMNMGEKALPVLVEAARLLASMIEDLDQVIGVLEGDVKDTNAVLDKSSDQWIDWAGIQQSAMATGITAGREFGGVIKSIFGGGGEVQRSLFDTGEMAERMAERHSEIVPALGSAAAGAQGFASAADSLRASLAGANQQIADMMSLLGSITDQRTVETNAIDQEINALEQELNAAEQAGIGQQALGGAVESTTSAIDAQIGALENQAAALIPQAIEDEIIALEAEATALQLTAAEIEGQIIAKQGLIDANQDAVDAIQAEVDALDDLMGNLESTAESLDKQIEAEKALAAERAGTLGNNIKLNKLELEKEKLLKKAGGNVDNLSKKEQRRLKRIEKLMDAERRTIRIKELEAEATELQAQKSGKHLKALEAEKAAIEAEIIATQNQIDAKNDLIDTLHPPELLDEIEALEDHKSKVEDDLAAVNNLKDQRELYIKTLVPPELQQEIEKLKDEKTALDNANTSAGNLAGTTSGLTDNLADQIDKLNLEKQAIDLVTEGWKLQGEAMAGLPTLPDIKGQLAGYKALLMLDFQAELLKALKAGDFAKVGQLAAWIAQLGAMTFAQHGFHGTVTKPTLFVAGEAGQERVDITPGGSAAGRGGNIINHFHFDGPILGDHRQAMQLVEMIRPELERTLT
jgi:TP901 family phage tail tape measure protein